jgi:Anti-sigma-K factor rskA
LEINDIISSGLLECYVLGKTTEQETQQVLAWKALHPEVAAEILAIEDSLEQLDFAQAVAPSAQAKNNLLAKLNAQQPIVEKQTTAPVIPITEAPVVKMSNKYKYAAAAGLLLFAAAAFNNLSTYSKYRKASDALAVAEQKIATQNEEMLALQNSLDGPLNSTSQQVVLKGTTPTSTSTAKIFWVRNTGEVIVEASGLPDAPQGMQYQLWAIVDSKPVDAGMIGFNKKGQKYNFQKMKSFGKAEVFAITLEKAGGSPTPTMEKMVVLSKI